MMSDEDYNAQGTFYFPAGYRNETQYIAFWDTVTVPDKVLRAILGVNGGLARSKKRERLEDLRARALRERERIGELEKLNTDLGRDTEGPFLDFFRRSLSKKEGELGRIENELANRELGDPDEYITPVLARPVARASGMAAYLPEAVDTATRDRILDHEFELGDGRWMSARDIVERFETLEFGLLTSALRAEP